MEKTEEEKERLKKKKAESSKRYYEKNKDRLNNQSKIRYMENKEEHKRKSKEYYEKNKDRVLGACREYSKDRRSDPRVLHKISESRVLREYGATLSFISDILDEQKGCCKVCGKSLVVPESKSNYHIDHCHTTGKVRGLLCGNCNLALGLMYDNTLLLRSLLKYLEDSQDR